MKWLGELIRRVVGTPKDHDKAVKDHAVVVAPEFNITQYAKKLALVVGVILPAIVTGLKAAGVTDLSDPIVIGALGVVAASLIGVCLVMAVDIASRAYLTVAGTEPKAADPKPADSTASASAPASGSKLTNVVAVPAGSLAWLANDDTAYPVVAMAAGEDGTSSSYLLASGSVITHPGSGSGTRAFSAAPEWHDAKSVDSFRPAKWE